MPAKGLSVIIPGNNEEFMAKTIENVLENIEGDTEVIAVCDGYWPMPEINDHPKVTVIHHTVPVGQRAATNEGVRLSQAKYIMKLDAHCAVDKGFDIKLMQDCEYDWTVIPRLYNLHAFDWVCTRCEHHCYQADFESPCSICGGTEFTKVMVWKPRLNRRSDFARFDSDLHFQYWMKYEERKESEGDICDLMCHVGACWFMHRQRYLDIEGLDEGHGSWGQVGVEMACKSWLSGGRHVVNKKTWYSHMFRNGKNGFGFPYHMSGNSQDKARDYSRDMWFNNRWHKQIHPLMWLVDKFAPVPTWHDGGSNGVSKSPDINQERKEDHPQLVEQA